MSNEPDDANEVRDGFEALRRRAEAVLRGRSADPWGGSDEDVPKLLHELSVHQIELEMQNEELRRTQLALEVSRDSYVDLYDFAPVGYLTLSDMGMILAANLTLTRLLGVERANLVGAPLSAYIFREDQDVYYLHRRRLFETREPQGCELRLMRRDGSHFWARMDAVPVEEEGGQAVCRAAVNDVTERVHMDQALRESHRQLEETLAKLRETQELMMRQERLAAVGQLAAGIAHDFNNILATMVLYTQMSLRTDEMSAKLRRRLEIISEEANHAADLVQQILDFGRKSMLERRPLALESCLKEIVSLLQRTLPHSIRIDLTCAPGDSTISADPKRLEQVIVNLALNARDAMPGGGEITIALSRVEGRDINCVECGRVSGGEWVRVDVTDTGKGIPPDVLTHIFEPFFTTRAPLGHGLGLAQVFGIVAQHGGHIAVETEVGRGTTFTSWWPALHVTPSSTGTQDLPIMAQADGQTILVVEDNAAIRAALMEVMVMLGYQAWGSANGREALAVCEAHPGEIALVLSDWVMPSMGGLALVRALETQPMAPKLLVVTGQPLDGETRRNLPESVVGWVLKPPSVEGLAEAVARALAGGPFVDG